MDAIDRRVVTRNKARNLVELRAIVSGWRAAAANYGEVLADARPAAACASRLPRASDFGLPATWRTFLAMIRQRLKGMSESAGVFEKAIATGTVSPEMQTRLQRLMEEGEKLNAQYERVANRLNKKLG